MKNSRSAIGALLALMVIASVSIAGVVSNQGTYYTENRGQWDSHVLFKAEGTGGLTWFIERDGFTLLFTLPDTNETADFDPFAPPFPRHPDLASLDDKPPVKMHALKFKFRSDTIPSNQAASVIPSDRLKWNCNYFIGNDKSKWAPDCGNFREVSLHSVWPGIDVVWKSSNGQPEFDFELQPGADARSILVECLGLSDSLVLAAEGKELLLPTSLGMLRQVVPQVYWVSGGGSKESIEARVRLESGSSFGFDLPAFPNSIKKVVIDPLIFSTYLGGNSDYDWVRSIAEDGSGGSHITGYTRSNNFPVTEGAFQVAFGGTSDAFTAHFNGDGNPAYVTYLGGRFGDQGYGIAADANGKAILAGVTSSFDFPTTPDSYDPMIQENNAEHRHGFVTKLSSQGDALEFSTFLAGSSNDEAQLIQPLPDGSYILVGDTYSADFPVTDGAYQAQLNDHGSLFITKLNQTGSELVYSTLLGGNNGQLALGMALDSDNNILVCGNTTSTDYPMTQNAYMAEFQGVDTPDGIISIISADGTRLLYSSYIGGNSWDWVYAARRLRNNKIVVAGVTASNDVRTTIDGYQTNFGDGLRKGFILVLAPVGDSLCYGTYFGGNQDCSIRGIIPDDEDRLVFTGGIGSDLPVSRNAVQRRYGGGSSDSYIAWVDLNNNQLKYSTFLGGSAMDWGVGIVLDHTGGVLVTGGTQSDDFPTTEGAFQRNYPGGRYKSFIAKIEIGIERLEWIRAPQSVALYESDTLELSVAGISHLQNDHLELRMSGQNLPPAVSFIDHGDGSGTLDWQIAYGEAGTYPLQFTLSDGEIDLVALDTINIKPLFRTYLDEGWSLVSSPVPPEAPRQQDIWRHITDHGHLEIVKDQNGRFWAPALGFSNLTPWDVQNGYFVKLSAPDSLRVRGEAVADDSLIQLRRGWNIISYYPVRNIDAVSAFANIRDILIIAKDDQGRFYSPSNNFSNMEELRRGEGYQVKVRASVGMRWNVR